MTALTRVRIPSALRALSARQKAQDAIAEALAREYERTDDPEAWVSKGDLDRTAAAALGRPGETCGRVSWQVRRIVGAYIKANGFPRRLRDGRTRVLGLRRKAAPGKGADPAEVKAYWARRLAEVGFDDIEAAEDRLRQGRSVETTTAPARPDADASGWLEHAAACGEDAAELLESARVAAEQEELVAMHLQLQADVWAMHRAGLGPKSMEPWLRRQYGVGERAANEVLARLKGHHGIAINSLKRAASRRRSLED